MSVHRGLWLKCNYKLIDTLHAIIRTQTNSGPEKAMGCHYHQKLAKLDSFSLIEMMEKDKMLQK